jgi:hypothetical protein
MSARLAVDVDRDDDVLAAWLASRELDGRSLEERGFDGFSGDRDEPGASPFDAVDAVFEGIAPRRGFALVGAE